MYALRTYFSYKRKETLSALKNLLGKEQWAVLRVSFRVFDKYPEGNCSFLVYDETIFVLKIALFTRIRLIDKEDNRKFNIKLLLVQMIITAGANIVPYNEGADTGFKPVTSAIPVRFSINWAMKPHIGSKVNLLSSYLPVQWTAEQRWIVLYKLHIISLYGKIWTQQIDLAPNV